MVQDDQGKTPVDPSAGWRDSCRRWWSGVRSLLLLIGVGCTCAKHEAPAVAARALVMWGDMVFGRRKR